MKSPFPKRLAQWQATHNQLLREDAPYRKRFYSYLAANLGLSCVLLVFYLPFFGVRLLGPTVNFTIILMLAGASVGLALRQLHYQRASIKRYLESSRGI